MLIYIAQLRTTSITLSSNKIQNGVETVRHRLTEVRLENGR